MISPDETDFRFVVLVVFFVCLFVFLSKLPDIVTDFVKCPVQ